MLEHWVNRRNQHPLNLMDLRNEMLNWWLKLNATYLQNAVQIHQTFTHFLTEFKHLLHPQTELHGIK